MKIDNTNNLVFREILNSDNEKLGAFFINLSEKTKSKFGPHPLTEDQAVIICESIDKDYTKRFIIENEAEIIGYFILDFNLFDNEKQRYSNYDIVLDPKLDPVFAPCISDEYQNQGLASKAMKFIIEYAQNQNLRSLVLMGGTQEPNKLAINFYQKFGFKKYGEFYTDHNELNNFDMKLDL